MCAGNHGGKAKSDKIDAGKLAKIGRTVFHLWRKQQAFDVKKFLRS